MVQDSFANTKNNSKNYIKYFDFYMRANKIFLSHSLFLSVCLCVCIRARLNHVIGYTILCRNTIGLIVGLLKPKLA